MLQLLLAADVVGRNDEEIMDARPLLLDKVVAEVAAAAAAAAEADTDPTGSCWLWSEGKSANSGGGNCVMEALNGELSDMTEGEELTFLAMLLLESILCNEAAVGKVVSELS